jgi:peptidoglycan/xylan/chitin deacetylase (PgdA/CDA1 family)
MYRIFCLLFGIFLSFICFSTTALADENASVPVLVYHRFDPTTPGSMTITVKKFQEQLQWLKDNHYTVIPLRTLVNYLTGKGAAPPPKSVVITADDGRDSVYKYMWPLVRQYNIPVTLFIYPSAISNASYAMTWQQLAELQKTGLFDIQCHTYWHPNFNQEKKKLSQAEYEKVVHAQLFKSKAVLDKKLGINVDVLAWPFGIYNDYLEQQAAKAGYVVAFSIDARNASRSDKLMSEPRYMMVQGQNLQEFASIVEGHAQTKQSIAMQVKK